ACERFVRELTDDCVFRACELADLAGRKARRQCVCEDVDTALVSLRFSAVDELREHLCRLGFFEKNGGARVRDGFQFAVLLRIEGGEKAAELEIGARVVLEISRCLSSI